MCSTKFRNSLATISLQFLVSYPVHKMQITSDWTLANDEWQKNLLSCTLHHPAAAQYPPSSQYITTFLKHVVSHLEEAGVDIIDELYEAIADLLVSSQNTSSFCFKTYILENDENVVLEESTNIISNGTTGLCTWPASQHLSEFLLENKEFVTDKKVLELGSGLGFLGLVVCKSCQPSKFSFSDCHDNVLEKLIENVARNLAPESADCRGQSVDVPWSTSINGPRAFPISVLRLDWQSIPQDQLHEIGRDLDVVIAADVVYDDTIIPHLVRVLSNLLRRSCVGTHQQNPTAIICSTVRNPVTRDNFLTALVEAGLCYRCLQEPVIQMFYYDRSVPIQILRISVS